MFFNYDSFEIGVVVFVVAGILTYSISKSSPIINNDSLVNTKSSLDTISNLNSNIQLDNLPNQSYIEAGVQASNIDAGVQAATHVNTGVQTSARMWLESIRNWINEILGTPSNPSIVEGYVDVGIQTDGTSMWATVKNFFFEICSVRSSEISSIGVGKVDKWRNKLDSNQSVDLHDSNSPLTTLKFESDSELQNLVDPNDSASNVSKVVSETVNRVYDITDQAVLTNLMEDPTVYSYFDITEQIHYVISDVTLTVDPSLFIGFI